MEKNFIIIRKPRKTKLRSNIRKLRKSSKMVLTVDIYLKKTFKNFSHKNHKLASCIFYLKFMTISTMFPNADQ